MQIFIVQAEHPTVPGIVLKSFATRAAAVAEAVKLVNLIAGTPAATAENWEAVLEGLQEEHGAEHCDVSITKQDVVGAAGAPSDAPAPDDPVKADMLAALKVLAAITAADNSPKRIREIAGAAIARAEGRA